MAHIRRQRTNKRTTEKLITERAPVEVRSSSHSPETGELLNLTFKLPDVNSPELGAADTFYVVTLDRADVQTLWTYLKAAEKRRGLQKEQTTGLEAYGEDLTDQRILHGDPGDGYSHHTWPCSCGCKPVTQAQATERELRSRGLWPS